MRVMVRVKIKYRMITVWSILKVVWVVFYRSWKLFCVLLMCACNNSIFDSQRNKEQAKQTEKSLQRSIQSLSEEHSDLP